MAVLRYAIENWTDFDAYCLLHGFDPLEIPSRRLVAAAWAFLIKDMEPETIENLINDLTTDYVPPVRRSERQITPTDQKNEVIPADKWRAPEGWTPPGWNEERSYQESIKFMGFNADPK